MNPLLRRQLRRSGVTPGLVAEAEVLDDFLSRVERSYEETEKSRYLLERSLRLSSDEMRAVYEELREATETEVAGERDRLRTVVNGLDHGLFLLGEDGCLLFANTRAEEMLGSEVSALTDCTGLDQFELDAIGGQPFSTDRLLAGVSAGGSYSDEFASLRTANGGKIPVALRVLPIVGGSLVTFRDRRIEVEREARLADSEARFQTLFERSPVASYELDLTGPLAWFEEKRQQGVDDIERYVTDHPDEVIAAAGMIHVVSANAAAGRLFGHDGAGEVLGAFNAERLDPSAMHGFAKLVGAAFRQLPSVELEMTMRGADGQPLHVVASYEAQVANGQPDFSRVILTLTDITDRKEEEQRVAELMRSKDDFLASVSHQIRTPLSHVMTSAELLRNPERLSGADREELLGMIVRGASEMRSFVDDLLASARGEDGLLAMTPKVADVGRIVDEILEVVTRVHGRKQARNATAGVVAWADPERLKQVLRNLIANAFDHGGQNIEVSAVRAGFRTIIEVRDDGIGVPPDEADRIFDAYWAGGTIGRPESLGLGLAVSRSLAEAMDGTLSYVRRAGMTVLSLDLPAPTDG